MHLTLLVINHSNSQARTKYVLLFKVPYICLRRVVRVEGISVFIFFLAQYVTARTKCYFNKG